jgi:serine/threonine protein kinase
MCSICLTVFEVMMEFLQGGTVDQAVGGSFEFNEKHIAFICREALTGIAFLHSKKYAHRYARLFHM